MRRLLTATLGFALVVLVACDEGRSTSSSSDIPSTGGAAAVAGIGTTPANPDASVAGSTGSSSSASKAPVAGSPQAEMIANAPKIEFAPPRPDAVAWVPQDGAAAKGVVTLKAGTPGRRKKISMAKDEKCANEDAREEGEVVDKDSKAIKNVFVVVVSGHEKLKFETPKEAMSLHQKGCMYDPHVFGVMPGQEIKVINDDDTMHNIHGVPVKSKEFNFTQPNKGQTDSTKIENVENAVKIKCDVHPWMSAFAFVVPHRLFAVTDEQGKFEIKGLPDGAYEVMAWHEVYGEVKSPLKVEGGKAADLNFGFEKK